MITKENFYSQKKFLLTKKNGLTLYLWISFKKFFSQRQPTFSKKWSILHWTLPLYISFFFPIFCQKEIWYQLWESKFFVEKCLALYLTITLWGQIPGLKTRKQFWMDQLEFGLYLPRLKLCSKRRLLIVELVNSSPRFH